ncbi:ABC transporter ATP-binding protein [Rossellomorea aquimaris]|uniref:ABC transporter ATP-binding protein n=1 Tax=Rossellomorea aquimaris TaxID=189382 RepID=UPI0005CB6607|nr:ABC transporter ATP-binding protein [Rossellomorea aquimaris]
MNVLEVTSLEKKYREKPAVKNLSFQLEQGRCTALLGPNGAGKTTTLNMLAGLITPTNGLISTREPSRDIREMIGYLPQYPSFFEWMKGKEFLIFSGEIAGLTRKSSQNRSEELLELVGLQEGKDRIIGHYSGGMKQRLGIAQALIHQPKLLILDEPVSALDPFGRREVLELLKKLKKETTILFSTHILNDAEQVCDDVLFLHGGVLIEEGPLVEVKKRHQTPRLNLYFNEDSEKYKPYLLQKDWVHHLIADRNRLSFEVSELERDRARIFSLISENHWGVTRFETSEQSLEELFMEVIKK